MKHATVLYRRTILKTTVSALLAVCASAAVHVQAAQSSSLPYEVGAAETDQSDRKQWHTVQLENSYDNPVVIMGPLTSNGGHPAHIRLRKVESDSFEFKIEEWAYLDGGHTTETASYIVIDAGTYTIGNGTTVEIKQVSTHHTWRGVQFDSTFNKTPVVLTQVQTRNGGDPVVTRQRNATAGGFSVRLQEEESKGSHTTETIGYVAIEPSAGMLDGHLFEAGIQSGVDHNDQRISFQQEYGEPPAFIATIQTFDGPNTAGLRYHSLSIDDVKVFAEEEGSSDSETSHAEEGVGYLSIGPAALIQVELAIKPESDDNPINPKSKGYIPVAILHADEFNPITQVDVSSVRFGDPDTIKDGNGAVPAHDGHTEDVNDDGNDDLVLHFRTKDTGFDRDSAEGKLVGLTNTRIKLTGSDAITIVGNGENKSSGDPAGLTRPRSQRLSIPSMSSDQAQQALAPTLNIMATKTGVKLIFSTEDSATYVLEYKDSLTDPTWKRLKSIQGDGDVHTVREGVDGPINRIYRVRRKSSIGENELEVETVK